MLRVGYSPSVDEDLMVGATQRLLQEMPAARLTLAEFLTQDLLDRLVDGELDLVVAPLPAPMPADITAAVLYEDRLHIVADREHPLLRRSRLRVDDVAGEPWLLPTPHIRVRRLLEQRFAQAGLPALNARVESDSLTLRQFGLLRGTRMLSICSEWSAAAMRRMGLELLPVSGLGLEREIAAMRRAGGYVSPLSERLETLCHAAAKRRTARAAT